MSREHCVAGLTLSPADASYLSSLLSGKAVALPGGGEGVPSEAMIDPAPMRPHPISVIPAKCQSVEAAIEIVLRRHVFEIIFSLHPKVTAGIDGGGPHSLAEVRPGVNCHLGRLTTPSRTIAMPSIPKKPQTEDSKTFDPDTYFEKWSKEEITPPYDNDFRKFIIKTFDLPIRDDYGYMAQNAQVTLLQAQTYIEWGGQGNLHAWYRDADGQVVSGGRTPVRKTCSYANEADRLRPAFFIERTPDRYGYCCIHRCLPPYDQHE